MQGPNLRNRMWRVESDTDKPVPDVNNVRFLCVLRTKLAILWSKSKRLRLSKRGMEILLANLQIVLTHLMTSAVNDL